MVESQLVIKENIQITLVVAIFSVLMILLSWWEISPIPFNEWFRICNSYTNDCIQVYWHNKIYFQNIAKISFFILIVDLIVLIYFLLKNRNLKTEQ